MSPTSSPFTPMHVTHLTTEGAMNPLGLEEVSPRFRWQLVSGERGQEQTACRVLVASSPERLKADEGDVWDSGKVQYPGFPVVYNGPALSSGTRYYWKARAWDREDRPTAWSDPAWWEMGLLQPSDWQAKWIGGPTPDKEDAPAPAPLLRRAFMLDKPVKRARLYISGLGYYDLSVNGHRAGNQVLDPAYTRFDRRFEYVTHDVTGLLREGENALGITLGRGWYGMTTDSVWGWNKAVWHGEPRLLLQLVVEHPDGSRTVIASDESWKAHDSPTVKDSLYAGETYDARQEIPGWDAPGFDDSSWPTARPMEAPKGQIHARQHEPIRVVRTHRAKHVAQPKPGVFVFDMGQNIAGWARLKVNGPAGITVTLRYGEKTRPDGTVDNSNDLIHEEAQVDHYTLKGGGEEYFEPRFSYKGFQFVQLDGYPGTPPLDAVEGCEVHSDVRSTGSFECSDETLNAIHRLTRQSLLNNLYGIPTDTPVYEKNGWTGDAQLTAETMMREFDVHRVYAKWLDDLADCQDESGLVPIIAPTGGWGQGNSPEWGGAFITVAWDLYRHYGDQRVLSRHYDQLARYMRYLDSQLQDGISPSILSDWLPPGHGQGQAPEGPGITATAYVHLLANTMANIARTLGRGRDVPEFEAIAKKTQDALNAHFLDKEKGLYHTDIEAGYRQTSSVLPLAFGMVPPGEVDRVVKNLVDDIHMRGDHLDTGILGTKELLPVLTDQGYLDLVTTVATQRTHPSWGFWLEQGATTLWESWDLDSRSRDHHMFGSIEDWFYGYLAGIRIDAPGYERIVFKPYIPKALSRASASIDTVLGLVSSRWEKKDGSLSLSVTVPVGATAEVHVPARSAEDVTEGGHPAANASGVTFLRMEGGRAVYRVGSGEYRFAIPWSTD